MNEIHYYNLVVKSDDILNPRQTQQCGANWSIVYAAFCEPGTMKEIITWIEENTSGKYFVGFELYQNSDYVSVFGFELYEDSMSFRFKELVQIKE